MTTRKDVLVAANEGMAPEIVSINHGVISTLRWPDTSTDPMTVDLDGKRSSTSQSALAFLIGMTCLNYRFWWRQSNGELARYAFGGLTGARALWNAFKLAWGDNDTAEQLVIRLGSNFEGFDALFGNILDRDGRVERLREVLPRISEVSLELSEEINEAKAVTVKQSQKLATYFPVAYGDPFLKKAQLALSLFAAHRTGLGDRIDVADLTAFADYQVPRVLEAIGVLAYSPELSAKIASHTILPCGGREEMAIRSATILACELIAEAKGSTAADVDGVLWLSQGAAGEKRFHLCETGAY